jgi:hypothetical protein
VKAHPGEALQAPARTVFSSEVGKEAECDMAIEALDRRHEEMQRESALRHNINEDQMLTLRVLEGFGWSLKFVRKSKTGPLAAVYDPEKHALAIIEPDGRLNEKPDLAFRPN